MRWLVLAAVRPCHKTQLSNQSGSSSMTNSSLQQDGVLGAMVARDQQEPSTLALPTSRADDHHHGGASPKPSLTHSGPSPLSSLCLQNSSIVVKKDAAELQDDLMQLLPKKKVNGIVEDEPLPSPPPVSKEMMSSKPFSSSVPGPPPLVRYSGTSARFNLLPEHVTSTVKTSPSFEELDLLRDDVDMKLPPIDSSSMPTWEPATKPDHTHALSSNSVPDLVTDKTKVKVESIQLPGSTSSNSQQPSTPEPTKESSQQVDRPGRGIPSVLSDRVVQTPYGLAILIDPSRRPKPSMQGITPARKFQHWSKDEDNLLKTAVEMEGGSSGPINWKAISNHYFCGNRNPSQCKNRWKKALDPTINRDPFTAAEDEIIISSQQQGLTWSEIAKLMPGRVADQIRERFVNQIDPSLQKKVPWTEEERTTLFQAQKKLGNKWTAIAQMLPGRSENDVKNQWHNAKMASRRAMRRLGKPAQVAAAAPAQDDGVSAGDDADASDNKLTDVQEVPV